MKKFLYKIHSGYNGFTPARIPERLLEGKRLQLGWQRYIEAVDLGDEVLVYFHGPHKFENGVYIDGIVQNVDITNLNIYIRVRNYSVSKPLTDPATSQRIAEVVKTRFQQVFLYPQEWIVAPNCTIDTSADSCQKRMCASCPTWNELPLIGSADCYLPARLPESVTDFVPAYWVIPRRCYLGSGTSRSVRRTSDVFYRFKTGEKALAFPLALGIYEALRNSGSLDFDCIVPIPLSPDKVKAKEINRTLLLAEELSKLSGIKVVQALKLNRSISKRRMYSAGYTRGDFERAYYDALTVSDEIVVYDGVLLLDDVCTEGTTLGCAIRRIKEVDPDSDITAVTAGQMIVKAVVRNERAVVS
jgi:predicted amidophosphoribosyltransferase